MAGWMCQSCGLRDEGVMYAPSSAAFDELYAANGDIPAIAATDDII